MSGDDQFELTASRLKADIADGLFTRGAQVSISVHGQRRFSWAGGDDGLGRTLQPDTLFRVYCTAKPLTAVAVARLVEDGHLDLDDPLEDVLPETEAVRSGVTLRQILTHTAGLHLQTGLGMEMAPPVVRAAMTNGYRRPPGWRLGVDAAYAEHLGWTLLQLIIEQITETPARDHLRRSLLEPLGMHDTAFGTDPGDLGRDQHRMGVNVDVRALRSYPMLFERLDRVRTETNLAYGCTTTAHDLDRFYAACLRALDGEAVPGLPSQAVLDACCCPQRMPVHDLVLDRTCGFGLGFMTGLEDHRFGRHPSASAFGHSGNVGSSFAFADPEHGLSAALVLNGLVDHESAFLRRQVLVDAIYRDLELDGRPSEEGRPSRGQDVHHTTAVPRRNRVGRRGMAGWRRAGQPS